MGENQNTTITGHVEIAGLGCRGERLERLKGKKVSVFTLDGNVVSGEILEANLFAVYIAENAEHTRMIKASAIASISLDRDDAAMLFAKENFRPVLSPDVFPKKPIRVRSDLPRL